MKRKNVCVIMNSVGYFRNFYNWEIIRKYKNECKNSIKLNPRQEHTMKYISLLES